jgi:TetR/AcrR family transcriptional repressor of nem operon
LPEPCAAYLTKATAFPLLSVQRGAALIGHEGLLICSCLPPFLYYGYNTNRRKRFFESRLSNRNSLFGVFTASQPEHFPNLAMRYSKEHKAETHTRIVQKASERFRAEGVDSVGVGSLMQSLGLTVGGFYAHFESKEDLIAQACRSGFSATNARFKAYIEKKPPGHQFAALVDAYLSPQHRDGPDAGCFAAATGAEMARHPDETRVVLAEQVDAWIGVIATALENDKLDGEVRGIAGTLVGCLILARSMPERAISDAFLDSGRKAALASVRPRIV